MLSPLLKLGEQLSEGRGEWDDMIDFPNITKEKEKKIKCFVTELVFDLDSNTVYISPGLKKEYEEKDRCVESDKNEQI